MNKYSELINNMVSFGNSDDRIIAIILVGSQARKEKTLDEYSDLDVDFVIISENDAKTALLNGESRKMICNGYRILVDKKRMQKNIPALQITKEPYTFPAEVDYVNIVNDF